MTVPKKKPKPEAEANPNRTRRTALYERISSVRQEQKELSIPAQDEALRRSASTSAPAIPWLRASAIEVVKVYEEPEAVSGGSTDRPAFQELLRDVRSGAPFDLLMTLSDDRLARNVKDMLNLVDDLADRGVDILLLDWPVDLKDPKNRRVLYDRAIFSEQYITYVREKTKLHMGIRKDVWHMGSPGKYFERFEVWEDAVDAKTGRTRSVRRGTLVEPRDPRVFTVWKMRREGQPFRAIEAVTRFTLQTIYDLVQREDKCRAMIASLAKFRADPKFRVESPLGNRPLP